MVKNYFKNTVESITIKLTNLIYKITKMMLIYNMTINN